MGVRTLGDSGLGGGVMIDVPGELSGSHPLVNHINRLRAAVKARTPRQGCGVKLKEGTDGFIIQSEPGGARGSSEPAASVESFSVRQMFADVMLCRRTSDGVDHYVIKPTKLRNSIGGESLDGVTILYSYDLTYVARVASFSGTTEAQLIVPRYIINDIIWAIPVPEGNYTSSIGVTVVAEWMDINVDGRAWATTQIG